jgi:hypothetical protein
MTDNSEVRDPEASGMTWRATSHTRRRGAAFAAATRWSYWLMLQVKGKVAVRPWSAFVATPESSWTVTT